MSKKSRKKTKKVVPLPATTFRAGLLFCGFPLIEKNINQLWRWDSLEDVKSQ